ncbi:MAG: neutral/alkaline non-lysosomal ceramidase N-terminal domain-containing protein, partial [Thermogutta sp.]|uniref:neutral/alkaline non-lysosomal ceramidase N-terminal domain-containing protein n=1 Tax=Thermogutta sp. TaxID=1962930 RepID=UPI0019B1F072
MIKNQMWWLAVAVCLPLVSGLPRAWAVELWVGSATVDITPPRPVALEGQFHTRVASRVETPLVATALVLESREKDQTKDHAVMVSCDLVGIPEAVLQKVRERISQSIPRISPEKIILTATHTHTAPVVTEGKYVIPDNGIMTVSEYVAFFVDQVAEAVQEAWQNRQVAQLGYGLGYAVVGHNRRAVYADGRATMYGRTDVPNFRHLESGTDPAVQVLFFTDRSGALLAMAIEVACPSQEVEGRSTVHADYWHFVRQELWRRLGRKVDMLAWCGAAGDLSPHLMLRKAAEERMLRLRGLDSLQEIARRISETVMDAYNVARQELYPDVPFEHRVLNVDLPLRVVTDEEARTAREEAAKLVDQPALRMKMLWYQRVAERYERQQQLPPDQWKKSYEIHVIRLGDVAIATNPFELFVDFGLQIQSRSKATQTF